MDLDTLKAIGISGGSLLTVITSLIGIIVLLVKYVSSLTKERTRTIELLNSAHQKNTEAYRALIETQRTHTQELATIVKGNTDSNIKLQDQFAELTKTIHANLKLFDRVSTVLEQQIKHDPVDISATIAAATQPARKKLRKGKV